MGEWKLLLLQAFQTGRRATNELISMACHAAMRLRPAPGAHADLMASNPAIRVRNTKYPHYITNSGWAITPAAGLSFLQHRSLG
jgi:methionine-rich copper-binding protein CopC